MGSRSAWPEPFELASDDRGESELFGTRPTRRSRVLVLTLVLCLTASAIPAVSLASMFPAEPVTPNVVAQAGAPPRTLTAASVSVAPGQLTASERSSICLLGVLPSCRLQATTSAQAISTPQTSGTDPPSSWTNATPPSGAPNPTVRFYPSMTYYPSGHEVLMFGGYGEPTACPLWCFYQDTWAYAGGHWTELVNNVTCTPSTCPAPRAAAMMTYYPPAQGVLLYGGYYLTPSVTLVTFSDTWLFSGGSWHNITASAGTPPSPRYDGSMVWDSADGYAVLFGGAQNYGATLGDTWTFKGSWTNITGSLSTAPEARAGAAISNSPSGHILMFGGEYNGSIIEDYPNTNCPPAPQVGWWFYQGAWSVMAELFSCVKIAASVMPNALADPVVGQAPPCGRLDAALGWSPQNERFVLYGGIGPLNETSCTGFQGFLNDTWTYQNPPGASFYWQSASDAGDPPAREQMGYASDFTDNYFEIFGGWGGYDGGLNDTWRFFELVHAKLSGPSSIDTGSAFQFNVPFTVVGFGGTNDLNYSFTYLRLRNGNSLQGTGCTNITTGSPYRLPYDGVEQIFCQPTQQSYNIYRLTVLVLDNNNATDRAWANWTVTVIPPEIAVIYSEYVQYFYTNFDFNNVFSTELVVANAGASSVSATLGGQQIHFSPRSGQPFWWDSDPVNMGDVTPGSVLQVSADFSGWSLNATYQVQMIDTPSWLSSIFILTGAQQAVVTKGAGPYNKTFSIYENYTWDLGKAFGFSIPVPLAGGNYNLIPTVSLSLSATSKGDLNLKGAFSLDTPKINLGVVSLKLDATISMQGTFALNTEGPEITGITWLSAKAVVSLTGDFSASVPIYGFNILGVNVGFTLAIDLKPSVALNLILTPTTDSTKELISGLQVMVSQLYGTFALPLSVSVSFGIGIASVSMGGKLEVDLSMGLIPTAGVLAGWVNGSVIASASALFWSDSWTLLGPATIYSWTDPPAAPVGGGISPQVTYNNGSGTTWTLNSRYYTGTGYDAKVWDGSASQGVAISDIYPHTQISGAAGYNGAYVFYSDDNAQLPVQQGLTVSGVRLDPSSNQLTALPAPVDSGYVIEGPKAATLPDGSLYVVWAALPSSETSLASPLDLTSLELHGAPFYPSSETWGPIHRWTTSGIVESYALDGTGSGSLVALVSPSFLLGATTSEQLLAFNLATGAQASSSSLTGVSEILSARGALGLATVQGLDGNASVVNLTTGAAVPLALTLPVNASIRSAAFVHGSASTLLLLIRTQDAAEIVLYDAATSQALATLPVTGDTAEVHAIRAGGSYYVFASTSAGVIGWKESGGSFENLTTYNETGIKSFDVVQSGASLALFALVADGNATQPIVNLTVDEIGAALPAVPGGPAGTTGSAAGSVTLYLAILGIVAAADAVLLALWVIRKRRERPPQGGQEKASPDEEPAEPPASPPGGS